MNSATLTDENAIGETLTRDDGAVGQTIGRPTARRRLSIVKRLACQIWFASMVAGLFAIPWLDQRQVVLTWAALAAAMAWNQSEFWKPHFVGNLLWGTVAIGIAFHWSPEALAYSMNSGYASGLAVAIPLILWDGLRLAVPFWLVSKTRILSGHSWLPTALLFLVIEQWVPTVFPWRIGYTQIAWPWTIQAVDIFGPAWSTFMAFAHAALLLAAIRWVTSKWMNQSSPSISNSNIKWLVGLCLVNGLYGVVSIHHWSAASLQSPAIRVALVQVDPSYVESVDTARRLTESVAGDVDLVCWPESIGGTYELSLSDLSDPDVVFAHSRDPARGLQPWPNPDCPLILGGKSYVGDGEQTDTVFMTAMAIDKHQRITAQYQKRYLMPFGEYVPASKQFPSLASLFDMSETIHPGKESVVLPVGEGIRVGTVLCFEDMVAEAARSFLPQHANLLVCLINGSSFESPYVLLQHRLLAQCRAIENRRYFLRCASTGETCVISPSGTIEAKLPLGQNGVLAATVRLIDSQPPSLWLAPWSPWIAGFALIGILLTRRRPT